MKHFDRAAALEFARFALQHPPAFPWIERRDVSGELVAEFVLPLRLCPTVNTTGQAGFASQRWRIAKLKKEVLVYMRGQHPWRDQPLPGRPTVVAIRFSSKAPDEGNNGAKIAIDRLTVANNGLGFLRDDDPANCRQLHWWEPGPRGSGFVYLRIFA